MPYPAKKSIPDKIVALVVLALFFVIGVLSLGMDPAAASLDNVEVDNSKSNGMKIATVTEMYTEDVNNQYAEKPTLMKYANQDLQKALLLEQDYFDQYQMICGTGHDVLWDSQDPDYAQDKKISISAEGLVQVNLAQGSDVYYQLTCAEDYCQVADVIMADNKSLKDLLNNNCR